MNGASKNNHVAVLEWWKQSGLKCIWTSTAYRQGGVFDWWMRSGLLRGHPVRTRR